MKNSKVSIKTRSTPASLSFKGQATKHTTVKWSIVIVRVEKIMKTNCTQDKIEFPIIGIGLHPRKHMNKQPLKTLANCFITDKRYQKEYQQNVLNQYYPSDTLTGTKCNVAQGSK